MAELYTAIRLVHVLAAAAWFGGALFMVTRIGPAVKHAGPAAGPFRLALLQVGGVSPYFALSAILVFFSGLYLYMAGGFAGGGFNTAADTVLNIGVAAGLIAVGLGGFVVTPLEAKMKKLVREHGPDLKPEHAQQLMGMGQRLLKLAHSVLALVSIAILAMAGRGLFI